jgi:hypothetical protein
MPGFQVYRSDRNQFDGEVMLLVKNNLRHDSFSLPPTSGLEATAVRPQLHNHNQLLFVSACHHHCPDGPRRHLLITRHHSPCWRSQLQARVME